MATTVHTERQGSLSRRLPSLKCLLDAALALGLSGGTVLGLAALSGSGHRWIDILAQFTAPALIAVLVGTVVAGLARLRLAPIAGALASAVLLLAVWPQWMPTRGQPAEGQPTLRVYFANLYARNTDAAAMTASIRDADADIVILVEFGDAPAAEIKTVLAGYPHRVSKGRVVVPTGSGSAIVASRYPISQPLPASGDGLFAVGAVVETPLGPVNAYAVHLTRPWPYQFQWAQIRQVMSLTEQMSTMPDNPVIVAGDFNSVSSARIGRQVRDDLGLIPAPGFPGTWPARLPGFARINIDQVYRSDDLALMSRRLGKPTGSDHAPVITEFARAAIPDNRAR